MFKQQKEVIANMVMGTVKLNKLELINKNTEKYSY